jgi:hypothetical protein
MTRFRTLQSGFRLRAPPLVTPFGGKNRTIHKINDEPSQSHEPTHEPNQSHESGASSPGSDTHQRIFRLEDHWHRGERVSDIQN